MAIIARSYKYNFSFRKNRCRLLSILHGEISKGALYGASRTGVERLKDVPTPEEKEVSHGPINVLSLSGNEILCIALRKKMCHFLSLIIICGAQSEKIIELTCCVMRRLGIGNIEKLILSSAPPPAHAYTP